MSQPTVIVGSICHETNTFASAQADRSAFERRREFFGDDVPANLRGTNTATGGVIDAADRLDIELRYTVAAMANPSNVVTAAAYDFYTERVLEGLYDAKSELDAVMLPLHGAMVTEDRFDGEGPLATAVREVVGPDVPIGVTLDLHGNVSDELLSVADVAVAYETYPHVDMAETGRLALSLLLDALEGTIEPVMAVERPPVLISGPKQNTGDGPMAAVMDRARELEAFEDVLKVNVLPGFYPADTPDTGASIVVVADRDAEKAARVANSLGRFVWERRTDFVADGPEPTAAVRRAQRLADAADTGPVVIADVGDNPGGGGTADETAVLRELLEREVGTAGFAVICDPEVVADCIAAGVGTERSIRLGGKSDRSSTNPVETQAYVRTVTDGQYVHTGPMSTGSRKNLGRTVVLECGPNRAVSVVVTEYRVQPMDAEIWRHVGIQPERLDTLAVKSTNHYRADYEPMASRVIPVNSPGLFAADPRRFEYELIERPQFPLDDGVEYAPGDERPQDDVDDGDGL